jgi:hypothetical protein
MIFEAAGTGVRHTGNLPTMIAASDKVPFLVTLVSLGRLGRLGRLAFLGTLA